MTRQVDLQCAPLSPSLKEKKKKIPSRTHTIGRLVDKADVCALRVSSDVCPTDADVQSVAAGGAAATVALDPRADTEAGAQGKGHGAARALGLGQRWPNSGEGTRARSLALHRPQRRRLSSLRIPAVTNESLHILLAPRRARLENV